MLREAPGMTAKRRQSQSPEEPELDLSSIETASERAVVPAEAPEVSASTQELTEWDTPPQAAGSPAPVVPAEDEATIGEQLTEAGVEEADRDQRMAAADPDFQP